MLKVKGVVGVEVGRDEVDVILSRHNLVEYRGRHQQHLALDARFRLDRRLKTRPCRRISRVFSQDRCDDVANESASDHCVVRIL